MRTRFKKWNTMKRAAFFVYVSILLHMLLLAIFPNHEISKTSAKFQPVKIRIAQVLETPKFVEAKTLSAQAPSKVIKEEKTQPDASESENSQSSRDEKLNSNYHSLLPSVGSAFREESKSAPKVQANVNSLSSKVAIGRSYGLTGERLEPKDDYNLDQLASKLIIPHEWREKADESHAVAMIRRDEHANLWLDTLHGDPLLRAVLYQNLLRSEFIASLDRELSAADIKEFKIVLRFVAQNDSYRGLNTEISAFRDGLVVTKTLPPVMRIFKGVALSDSYAERAKQRERIEINKLMELPAFHHRIEHLLLKAG